MAAADPKGCSQQADPCWNILAEGAAAGSLPLQDEQAPA